MIKLAGAVMIILGTCIYGYINSGKYHKRYRNLIKINSCLSVAENEIEFSNSSLEEIFKKVSDLTDFDKLFKSASENLLTMNINTAWESALKKDMESLFLEKSDAEILLMLGMELGKTNRKGQIKNIKHIKNLIEKNIDEAYEKCQKEAKLTRNLSVAGGVLVAILLM